MALPPTIRPPGITRRAERTERRTANLERDRIPAGTSFRDPADVDPNPIDGQLYRYDKASGLMLPTGRQCPFIQVGTVTVGSAPPADLLFSGVVTEMHARLGTAGSSATVLTLALNGAVIVTLTIPANTTTATTIATDPITGAAGSFVQRTVAALTDRLVVAVTSAGSGAADLSGWVVI